MYQLGNEYYEALPSYIYYPGTTFLVETTPMVLLYSEIIRRLLQNQAKQNDDDEWCNG